MRLAAALALLLAAPTAMAATIHVPGDQPTIQAAVDVASDGDTVLLADGTYQGPGNRDVSWVGKQLVIRSASDDPHLCVLDPQGASGDYHRAFLLENIAGTGATLRSVTITGGHAGGPWTEAKGGAIHVTNCSEPLFENVRFVSNTSSEGGAVYLTGAETARFVGCEFMENLSVEGGYLAFGWGGSVYLRSSGASFVSCRFARNGAHSGGAIKTWFGSVSFLDCTFENNRADDDAGAVSASGVSITDSWFVGNRCGGHAGALQASAGLDLVGSTFSGNEAVYSGGAVRVSAGPVTIEDCDFIGNSAIGHPNSWGGGLYLNTEGPIAVVRCRFVSNLAQSRGGAIHTGFDTTGEIRESLFVDNSANDYGGALFLRGPSFLVEQSTLVGSSAPSGGGIVFSPHTEALNPELVVRRSVVAFSEAGGAVSCWYPGMTIACSNVFANTGGDALCGTDGGDNFSADPLFCDAESGDFTLRSDSPCLPGNHPDGADCGLIGAFGAGCGPVSVEQESWAGIKARYRRRQER